MARKRKTAPRRSRSRSIGAKKQKFDFMNSIMAVAGGVGGSFLNKIIPDTIDPKISAGAKIVLGAVLPMMSKDQKSRATLTALGNGLTAIGGVELMTEFGIISGYGDYMKGFDEDFDLAIEVPKQRMLGEDVLGEDVLGETDDLNVINDLAVINENDMDNY